MYAQSFWAGIGPWSAYEAGLLALGLALLAGLPGPAGRAAAAPRAGPALAAALPVLTIVPAATPEARKAQKEALLAALRLLSEDPQAELVSRVCDGPLITAGDLAGAASAGVGGALPAADDGDQPGRRNQPTQWREP